MRLTFVGNTRSSLGGGPLNAERTLKPPLPRHAKKPATPSSTTNTAASASTGTRRFGARTAESACPATPELRTALSAVSVDEAGSADKAVRCSGNGAGLATSLVTGATTDGAGIANALAQTGQVI